jgi:hypothetical protein
MVKAAPIAMAMNGAYTYRYSDAHLRTPYCDLLTYADTRHYMYRALLYSVVEVIQDVTQIVLSQQEEERQEAMTAKLNAVLKAVRLSAQILSDCPACTSANTFVCLSLYTTGAQA